MPKRDDESAASSGDDASNSAAADSDIESGKTKKGKNKKPVDNSDSEGEPSSKGLLSKFKKKDKKEKKKKKESGDDTAESDGEASTGSPKKSMFSGMRKLPSWKAKKAKSSNDENDSLLGNNNNKKKKKKKKKSKHHETSKMHTIEILAHELKDRLVPNPKDIKGKPLHVSEAPLFVRADFQDGTGMADVTAINDLLRDVEDEKGGGSKKRAVYVYVESASSGRFFKYAMTEGEERGDGGEVDELGQVGVDDDFGESREAAMERLERLLHTGFLVLQGLLAGYSGETVYQAFAPTTDAGFLAEYSTLANETRRFYYILTTVSFVGALNNWRSVRDSSDEWRSRHLVEKVELLFLVFIYMAGLCFTLVAGVYDMDFYYHNGIEDDEVPEGETWYNIALEDTTFKETIRIWRGLTLGRFICVMVGWFMCARILHRNNARSADAIRESENISLTLEAAKKRIAQLTGAKLDKMAREDLVELARTQRNAIEQTEHVLENLPSNISADPFAAAPTTPRKIVTPGLGFGDTISRGSPARVRTQSQLPASISSKAPPPLDTGDTVEL